MIFCEKFVLVLDFFVDGTSFFLEINHFSGEILIYKRKGEMFF